MIADQRTNLLEVVGCAEGSETMLADGDHICFHFGVSYDTSKFLGYFVELFEFLAKGVDVFSNVCSEHVR